MNAGMALLSLPYDIINYIASFLSEYELLPELEIDIHKLHKQYLSENPNAVKFLEKHPHLQDPYGIALNPNAVDLIMKNQENICWYNLSLNTSPDIVKLLLDNRHHINLFLFAQFHSC